MPQPLTRRFPFLLKIQTYFRERRLQTFLQKLNPETDWKILDVGGTLKFWSYPAMQGFQATLINLKKQKVPQDQGHRIHSLEGSGLNLPFEAHSFDLLFSNSVIEHVGTWSNQQAFAAEARRVGKKIWIQTPAREFFLEPHYMTPFIHWFPLSAQRKLLRNATVWGLTNRPNKETVEKALKELRLISKREMKELFPDCEILVERFLGLPKSYLAVRK